MSESLDQAFYGITVGIGDEAFIAWKSGTPVLMSPTDGDVFKQSMLELYAEELQKGDQFDVGVDDSTHTQVDVAVENSLLSGRKGIGLDDLVAVGGIGVYLQGTDVVNSIFTPELLTPENRVFGKLAGVSCNDYPYVPGIEDLDLEQDREVDLEVRDGLVMVLASAMICSTQDFGTSEGYFDYVLIPMAEPKLRIFGAEVIE